MKIGRMLAIMLAVLLGVCFLGAVFIALFVLMVNKGYAIWVCSLAGLAPFFGAAIICGVLALVLYLLRKPDKSKNE